MPRRKDHGDDDDEDDDDDDLDEQQQPAARSTRVSKKTPRLEDMEHNQKDIGKWLGKQKRVTNGSSKTGAVSPVTLGRKSEASSPFAMAEPTSAPFPLPSETLPKSSCCRYVNWGIKCGGNASQGGDFCEKHTDSSTENDEKAHMPQRRPRSSSDD